MDSHRKRNTRARRGALLATASLAAVLGLTACANQIGSRDTKAAPQTLSLKASEFSFGAPTFTTVVGRPVRLVMDNAGSMDHDLQITGIPAKDVRVGGGDSHGHGHADAKGGADHADVMAHAAKGQQGWVEFTPTRAGTYEIECTIEGHKAAGMKATLVVSAPAPATVAQPASSSKPAPITTNTTAKPSVSSAVTSAPPPAPAAKVQLPAAPESGPVAFIPAEKRTPAQWMEYLGVRLVETRDSSGPAILKPQNGDLYYFSNESTTWGATNTRNEIVAIDAKDAKAKKVIARSELPDEYAVNRSSHGIGVSADSKWIYLPSIGSDRNFLLVIDGRTLKLHKVYESLGRPHHVNNFTAPDGRELIMIVDFGWNWTGSGAWVLDPSNDNQVVAGLSRADFSGHPYVGTAEVAGQYMYFTVPPATSALREDMEGSLMKVDLKTWKVVAAVPVHDPCWVEPTQDGSTVWVTECGASKVAKVDTKTMKVVAELATGPGPWGARLSYDESKLYVADKGEARGYGQQGRTMTIIDTAASIVSNVVPIGRTTDHVLISPDGKEIWAMSNADHGIWVIDDETEEVKQIIKMPADGDTHGGTWVRYFADTANGAGGIGGEVVSSYTGLRGTALAAQRAYLKQERPAAVTVTAAGVFSPPTLALKPGSRTTLTFVNGGGTNGKPVQLESKELGVAMFELRPGQRKSVDVTVPAAGSPQVALATDPTKALKVTIGEPKSATTAAPASAVREVAVKALNNQFDVKAISAKPGETIKITLANGDDENHNIVSNGGEITSPTVGGGQTGAFTWTAPATAGTFVAKCLFHPTMEIAFTVA
jgi:DNA-binding beta-propeller fold protein YncE/plastocyanin